MDVCSFIKAVLAQDENTIRSFFHKDAYVNWHCSNEHFTVDEFIIANCEYPGDWDGTVERVEVIGDLFITVTKVYPQDRSVYFHVVSFIRTANDKITSMDESVDISHILGNLITVIFNYQILRKPLKILSL